MVRNKPFTAYEVAMFPIRIGRMWQNSFYIEAWKKFWLDVKRNKREWMQPECPECGETKGLRIRIDKQGNSDAVECNACGWDDFSSHESRMKSIEA